MKELIVKIKSLQSQKIYWTMSMLMIEIVLIVFALNVGEKTIINWGISKIYIFAFLLIFFIVLGAILYILLFNYFDNKIIKMVESVGWNEFNSYLVDYKPHQLHYNRYLEIFNILKYKKILKLSKLNMIRNYWISCELCTGNSVNYTSIKLSK